MVITKEKIDQIREAIKKHYNLIVYKLAGPEILSDEEIQRLLKEGLIQLVQDKGTLVDAYYIGRVRSHDMGLPQDRDKISLNEFRRKFKAQGTPVNSAEQFAITHIEESAGNLLTGLRDKAIASITSAINDANLEFRNKVLTETVRPILIQGIEENRTIQQIASELRRQSGDLYRDFKRVSITETTNAMNLGEADAIIERNKGKTPDQIYVFKRVALDSALCNACRRLYIDESTGVPIIYKLSELQANGSNNGRKQAEYLPTIGVTHPNCRCVLSSIPDGFGFDSKGRLTFRSMDYKEYNAQREKKQVKETV